MQVSFNPEVERDARLGALKWGDFEASSSRYADPDAEGVTPVFRTAWTDLVITQESRTLNHTHFSKNIWVSCP